MALPNPTGRSRYTLLLLILTSVTLLTLDFRDFGPLESAREGAVDVFNPVRSAAETVFDPVAGAWNRTFGDDATERENEELRAEIERLRGQLIANTNADRLLQDVLAELDIEYVGNLDRVIAQVVSGPVGNFDDFDIEIDKGVNDGVLEGMPVVSNGGLIGRVVESGRNRSRVRLVSDPAFTVGVRLLSQGEDGDLALARGSGLGKPLVVTERIDPLTDVEVGEIVVTSGIDRSRYPGGIPIGIVTDVRLDEGALEQVLTVEPAADLATIGFVSVILFEPEE